MSMQFQYANQPPGVPKKKGGVLKYVALAIILIFGGLGYGGFRLYQTVQEFAKHPKASLAEFAINFFIEQGSLPPPDKMELQAEVTAFIDEVKEGKYADDEVAAIVEEMVGDRTAFVIALRCFDHDYVNNAGLSPAKKAAAKRITSRYS